MVRRVAARKPRRRSRGGPKRKPARSPRRTERARKVYALLGVLLVVLAASFLAVFAWSVLGEEPSGDLVELQVRSEDRSEVVRELVKATLISEPALFRAYMAVFAPFSELEVRPHLLRRGLSPRSILQRLVGVGDRESFRVTLPEGYTARQISQRLEEAGICSSVAFQTAVEIGGDAGGSAEGFLFPATYRFLADSHPSEVVARLTREARARLEKVRKEGKPSPDLATLGFEDSEIVTLASIIEKETGRKGERERVSRVFYNRLLSPEAETRGRLQSDPTAAYGCLVDPLGPPSCANYDKVVTPSMLRDNANPYNTYRHAGLPPGPIANPGEASLRAALRPSPGDELYFVANGKGGHVFSRDFAAHKRAVERLKKVRSE